MSIKTCLIVGGTGLLGPYLRDAAAAAGWHPVLLGRRRGDVTADITDPTTLAPILDELRPGLVIHAAALTDVDACERDPDMADAVNGDSVAALTAAMDPATRLVFLSTDQVYPDTPGPHREDATAPVNAYGRSKLRGERHAAGADDHLILRVNFFGPSRTEGRASLSDFVTRSLRDGRKITLFVDSIFSPLHAETLAELVFMAAAQPVCGTYNLGSRNGTSKAEFGLAIARHLDLQTDTASIGRSTVMQGRAPRPADLRMSVDAFEQDFGVVLPALEDEIAKLARRSEREDEQPGQDFLPYGRQLIDTADIAAVTRVLRSDWLTTGPEIDGLERDFAAAVGAHRAVACSSGTAALHLAFQAIGLGPGDIALVPTMTFLASANMVRLTGAEVIFVDVDPDTGIAGPDHYAEAAASLAPADRDRVKAIVPMATGGMPAHPEALWAMAQARGWHLVEDACHALGSTYGREGYRVGACAHATASTFSLHPVKTIAAGEGGIVTTASPDLAERIARLRNHGVTRDAGLLTDSALAYSPTGIQNPWYYEMLEPGFNYRLTDLQATLARSQLRKLDRFVARRRDLASAYREKLDRLGAIVRPQATVADTDPAWHLFAALVDFEASGQDRAAVMNALRAQGIGTQVHYIPLHRQPYLRPLARGRAFPGAEQWYARELSLPLFPRMANADVDRVVDGLAAALA